jgi:hypothetical protein
VAVVLAALIPAAYAQSLPDMKEGLWSVRIQKTEAPLNKKTDEKSSVCRSHAYDEHVLSLAKIMDGCTMISDNYDGPRHTFEKRCSISGTVVVSKGTRIQNATSTHSETRASFSPAMIGVKERTSIVDEQYLGACSAGSKAGDITTADGKVYNFWTH